MVVVLVSVSELVVLVVEDEELDSDVLEAAGSLPLEMTSATLEPTATCVPTFGDTLMTAPAFTSLEYSSELVTFSPMLVSVLSASA